MSKKIEDVDFQRWLEIMSARAVNLGKLHPIYGKYYGRKVWFWRDGSTLEFDLDQDGCVTIPVNDPANVKPEDILKPSERHAMTKPKLSRAQVVQSQLKALQAELAHLARFPEDNFDNGTVLQVVKTYKRPLLAGTVTQLNSLVGQTVKWNPDSGEVVEQQYTYVLLKANGQWWCTGQNGHQINGASWDKVIEFVDEDELIDVRTGLSVMTDAAVPEEGKPERPEPRERGEFLNPQLRKRE